MSGLRQSATLTALAQYKALFLAVVIEKQEETEINEPGREKVQMSLFAGDMILYLKHHLWTLLKKPLMPDICFKQNSRVNTNSLST